MKNVGVSEVERLPYLHAFYQKYRTTYMTVLLQKTPFGVLQPHMVVNEVSIMNMVNSNLMLGHLQVSGYVTLFSGKVSF